MVRNRARHDSGFGAKRIHDLHLGKETMGKPTENGGTILLPIPLQPTLHGRSQCAPLFLDAAVRTGERCERANIGGVQYLKKFDMIFVE